MFLIVPVSAAPTSAHLRPLHATCRQLDCTLLLYLAAAGAAPLAAYSEQSVAALASARWHALSRLLSEARVEVLWQQLLQADSGGGPAAAPVACSGSGSSRPEQQRVAGNDAVAVVVECASDGLKVCWVKRGEGLMQVCVLRCCFGDVHVWPAATCRQQSKPACGA